MTLSAAWGLPNMGERLISAWCYADVTVGVDPESALMTGRMLDAVTVSGSGSVVGHGCECCCVLIWQHLDSLQAPVHLGADHCFGIVSLHASHNEAGKLRLRRGAGILFCAVRSVCIGSECA